MDTTMNGYTTEHATTTPISNKYVPASTDPSTTSGVQPQQHELPIGSAPQTPSDRSTASTPTKRCDGDLESRKKLLSPSGCEIRSLNIKSETRDINILKGRFLLSPESPTPSADYRTSYKHFVDLHSSIYRCIDIYTKEIFKLKIVNEPLAKVQMAYFNLMQDNCNSDVFGHQLVRTARDLVAMSPCRTYVIVPNCEEIYENLHTYIRNKKRLDETEARALFHQICQTVQVCHRNGIILRDLKLKRFHFIDADRTKIQYESLEGSMILDDPTDDTLCDKIGCPLYTAPELLCPNTTYAGKPADMWSLGVLLYTMLVGQYPFYEKGGNNLITIIRHCQVQIPMDLSREVRWLLRSLLRRIPEERMKAQHMLYHPWLEKLKPYYMSITVDAVFSDTDTDDENEISDSRNHTIKHHHDNDDTEPKTPKRARQDVDVNDDDDEHATTTNTSLTVDDDAAVDAQSSGNVTADLGGL